VTNDPSRWLLALAAVGLWLVLIGLIVWRERRAKAAARARSEALAGDGEETVLVAFASQTGLAEELAWMTARALGDGGVGARVLSFADLDTETLKAADRALLIVSTTGGHDHAVMRLYGGLQRGLGSKFPGFVAGRSAARTADQLLLPQQQHL
jgi:sulfite reductase (NADPH) flavoprotein alpha-component